MGLILQWLRVLKEGLGLGLCGSKRHAVLLVDLSPGASSLKSRPSLTLYRGLDALIDSVSAKANSEVRRELCKFVSSLTRLVSTSLEAPLAGP